MMKHALLAVLSLFVLATPVLAQTKALPPGEIRSNGDITFGNALKIGKRQDGKTTITPDALEIITTGGASDAALLSAGRADFMRRNYTKFDTEDAGIRVQYGPNDATTSRLGGLPQFDAISGMITNSGPTNQTGQVSAIAGVVRGRVQNKTAGNNGYSVGGYFNGTCEVNNCVSWGINPVVADYGPDPSGTQPWINEPGVTGRVIEAAEIDVNVANPSTIAKGINLIGNFLYGNQISPTFGYLLDVNQFSPPWAQGYSTAAGAAATAVNIGQATKSGTNSDSQPINWNYWDGSGAARSGSLRIRANTQNGNLMSFEGNIAGVYTPNAFLPSGGQIQFRNANAGGLALQALYSDGNNTLHLANSTNGVQVHTDISPASSAGSSLGSASLPYNEVNAVTLYTVPRSFSQLPGSPRNGMRAIITDANSCTFNSAVAGGGSTICPVFYANGWKAGG